MCKMISEIGPIFIFIIVIIFMVRLGGAPSVNCVNADELEKKATISLPSSFSIKAKKKQKEPDKNPLKTFVAGHDICHLEQLWCQRSERRQHETICECFLEKLCLEYHQSHSKKQKRRHKDENVALRAQMLAYKNIEADIKACLSDHFFTPELVIRRLQAGK